MNATLQKVKSFAEEAHGNQLRKYSEERYIAHPIRVMQTCENYTDDPCVLAAALLHDVLEDTHVSRAQMDEFLKSVMTSNEAERTLALVVELTDVYTKKNYPALNRRARKAKEVERLAKISGDAQTIKYADIIDNATNIFIHDPDFAVVFIQEGKRVLRRMDKGDEDLHNRALKMIDDCLDLMDDEHEMLHKMQ